jgi:hypothetical protein
VHNVGLPLPRLGERCPRDRPRCPGKLEIVVDNAENIDKVAEALLFWKKAAAFSVPARDFNCGNLIEQIWSGNAASAP